MTVRPEHRHGARVCRISETARVAFEEVAGVRAWRLRLELERLLDRLSTAGEVGLVLDDVIVEPAGKVAVTLLDAAGLIEGAAPGRVRLVGELLGRLAPRGVADLEPREAIQ